MKADIGPFKLVLAASLAVVDYDANSAANGDHELLASPMGVTAPVNFAGSVIDDEGAGYPERQRFAQLGNDKSAAAVADRWYLGRGGQHDHLSTGTQTP